MTHVHTIPPHGGDALMHRPFQITVVHADQARAQVRAAGPLDRSTVDLLTAVLETMLGWGRRHVRLDMSRVTVTDEGCLPALVQVHEMFLAEHGLLVLTLPRPDLAALLRRAGWNAPCSSPKNRRSGGPRNTARKGSTVRTVAVVGSRS